MQTRSTLDPGTELAKRYTVKRLLGRGAMAAVYLAFDQKLNLDVALKVLPPQLAADPSFVARFRREGQTLARLTHPHVLRLYDIGEDDVAGLFYLVIEYLTGGTLKERIVGRPWDVPSVIELLKPVAGAVDYAHRRDPPIVHRDLKPANIMFGDERVVVSDFGLARIVAPEGSGADGAEASSATMSTGQILGTPSYMAPEQAEGRPAAPASDRYALGVVAYELLVGVVPFLGDTAQATLIQVATKPPPPPRQLNPALEEAVERVLIKALARNPVERFESGEELVASLADADQKTVALRVVRPKLAPKPDDFATLTLPRPAPNWRQRAGATSWRMRGGAALLAVGVGLAGLVLAGPRAGRSPSESAPGSDTSVDQASALTPEFAAAASTVDEEWAVALTAAESSWGRDWEQAVAGLDAFLGRFPDYPAALDTRYAASLALAETWIARGRVDDAVAELVRDRAAFPDRQEADALLAALTPTPVPTLPAATSVVVAPTRPPSTAVPPTQAPATPTKPAFAPPD